MTDPFLGQIKSRNIPPLYGQENAADPIVYVILSSLCGDWRWFVTEAEFEDDDALFFGFVCGFEKEWGYFRLSELRKTDCIISALFLKPAPISEMRKVFEL